MVAVQSELRTRLSTSDDVEVLINLREPSIAPDSAAMRELSAAVIASAGSGLTVTRRFTTLPAVAARISADALERLARDPRVASIQQESPGHLMLKEAVPAVGVDNVRSVYGLTGRGIRIGVLDTGVDLEHPDLAGVVVAQHCFTRAGCAPFFAYEGMSAQDDIGHGTTVASVLASRGGVGERGIAPEAELVAVKVFARGAVGVSSDWAAALEWLHDNLATQNVKVVSLGLGTNELHENEAACDRAEPALARAVKKLVDAGVVVLAASGNGGSSAGLPAPACNTGVIAVGASYDSDVGKQPADAASFKRLSEPFADCSDGTTAANQIACFTNTSPLLDLIAPGLPIVTGALGGGTEQQIGTSMSVTIASGVAALMLQCNPQLTPEQIRETLVSTGEARPAPMSGALFPSLRAFEAVRAACPDLDAGAPTAPGDSGAPSPEPAAGAPASGDGGKREGERRGALLGERYTGGAVAPPLSATDAGSSDAGDASSDVAGRGTAASGGATAGEAGGSNGGDSCSCRIVGGAPHGGSRLAWPLIIVALCLGTWRTLARRARRS